MFRPQNIGIKSYFIGRRGWLAGLVEGDARVTQDDATENPASPTPKTQKVSLTCTFTKRAPGRVTRVTIKPPFSYV